MPFSSFQHLPHLSDLNAQHLSLLKSIIKDPVKFISTINQICKNNSKIHDKLFLIAPEWAHLVNYIQPKDRWINGWVCIFRSFYIILWIDNPEEKPHFLQNLKIIGLTLKVRLGTEHSNLCYFLITFLTKTSPILKSPLTFEPIITVGPLRNLIFVLSPFKCEFLDIFS